MRQECLLPQKSPDPAALANLKTKAPKKRTTWSDCSSKWVRLRRGIRSLSFRYSEYGSKYERHNPRSLPAEQIQCPEILPKSLPESNIKPSWPTNHQRPWAQRGLEGYKVFGKRG